MSVENQSGDPFQGQNYSPRSNRSVRFTEQTMDIASANALLGNLRTEIIPIDKHSATVRVYSPTAADYEDYSEVLSGTDNLSLPDTLTEITVTYNKNELTGFQSQLAGSFVTKGAGSATFNPRSTAQASASIMPDVAIDIEQAWSQNVPVKHYGFYMPVNSTDAAILTKLSALAGASVTAWPVFRPVAVTLTLKGQQISISQSAEINEVVTFSATDAWSLKYGTGTGASREGGVTMRSIRIPATLHGLITITGPTATAAATTTVTTAAPAVVSTTSPALNTLAVSSTNNPTPITVSAAASVTPATFAATTPAAIPTSGLRLKGINPGEQEYGYQFLVATVFDFANLA